MLRALDVADAEMSPAEFLPLRVVSHETWCELPNFS